MHKDKCMTTLTNLLYRYYRSHPQDFIKWLNETKEPLSCADQYDSDQLRRFLMRPNGVDDETIAVIEAWMMAQPGQALAMTYLILGE